MMKKKKMMMMAELYCLFLLLSGLFTVCFAVDREKSAVLMLGNAGAGKSLLANILLNKHRFVSEYQVKQVTTVFEEDSIEEQGTELIVMDAPGLLDIDPEVQERNIKQVQEAFKQHNKQIVMYVFRVDGGRIAKEDMVTFKVLFEAYKFNQESVTFVMNGLRSKVYKNETKLNVFHRHCSEHITKVLSWEIPNIVLVPQFDEVEDVQDFYVSDQAMSVRQNLIESLNFSVYHPHNQINDIRLDQIHDIHPHVPNKTIHPDDQDTISPTIPPFPEPEDPNK